MATVGDASTATKEAVRQGAGAPTDAEQRQFIVRLQAAWASADPLQWVALCHRDVRLIQPLLPTMRGRDEVRRRFMRLFRHVPDLRVTLTRWGSAGDALLVEYVGRATLGGRPVEIPGVDRFLLRDGLIAERVAYFDSVPLAVATAVRPRALLQALRAGLLASAT